MSIFKGTFKQGVQDQLKARQESINDRTSGHIQYFNSRNSWIRMSSAVDVKEDKGGLAKNSILQGGTLKSGILGPLLRSGIGSNNQAYSTKTLGGQNNRLGIKPMPGITSLDVKSKSAYGSLREAIVSFQCWDIRQLEELELLYMRPGYSVLVEWGWDPYLDKDKNLKNNLQLPDYLFKKDQTKEKLWSETFNRASKDGNYDAVYGFVKNYSWKARNDGGYDCSVTIITMGEILESLKINYGAFNKPDLLKYGLFPVKGASLNAASSNNPLAASIIAFFSASNLTSLGINVASFFNLIDNVAAAYSQNIIAGICAELYHNASNNPGVKAKDESDYKFIDTNNNNYEYNFIKYKVEMTLSSFSINDGSTQIYIRLADFIEILNHYVLLSDKKNKTPIAKLSVHEPDPTYSGGKGNPLLCLGDKHQISTNPHICLIKNTAYNDPESHLGVQNLNVDSIKKYLSVINPSYNFLDLTTEFGEIGNIFVNLDYLYSLSINDTLAEKDKKEKNDIILFDYIKSMMSGINTAIGNVANFDIFIDPIDSVARIIDVNYIDTISRNEAYINAFEIQIHNLNSVVRDYSLESQIFPEQSTMIAIGAQVKGGALGTNTNTLVDYNKGLVDRIIPQKDAPTSPSNSSAADELAKLKSLQTNWAIIADLFIKLKPDWFSAGDYDIEESSKYANSLKDIINYFTSIINSNTKNRAIIPTKLSLTMDGIGGMIIGNMFKINEDALPSGYKGGIGPKDIGSRIGYIVTGLGHKINNNDWTTQVDAQFVILDEPQGVDKKDLPTVQAINRAVTSGETPPGRIGCAMGSNAVNPGVDYSEPAENSGINFSTFVYPVTATVNSLFIDRMATLGNIHRAIDLGAPTGTPCYSVCDGVVAVVGASGYGPNAIYIKVDSKYHSGKKATYYFIYGHLDTNIVNSGDKVITGQQIGTIGSKGKSGGPHLHLQLKNNTGTDANGTSYIFGAYFPGNAGCSIKALDLWGSITKLSPPLNALRVEEIAKEIKAATIDAFGTELVDFIKAVKKINNKETFIDVDKVLGTLVAGLNFQKILNDELGINDVSTAKTIRDHLLPFKVDINYKFNGNNIISNSFKVTVK